MKALEKAKKEHSTVENRVNDLTATAAQSETALEVLRTSSDAAQMFKLEAATEEASEETDRLTQVSLLVARSRSFAAHTHIINQSSTAH